MFVSVVHVTLSRQTFVQFELRERETKLGSLKFKTTTEIQVVVEFSVVFSVGDGEAAGSVQCRTCGSGAGSLTSGL